MWVMRGSEGWENVCVHEYSIVSPSVLLRDRGTKWLNERNEGETKERR